MEDLVCRDGSEFFKLSFLKRFLQLKAESPLL